MALAFWKVECFPLLSEILNLLYDFGFSASLVVTSWENEFVIVRFFADCVRVFDRFNLSGAGLPRLSCYGGR